MKALTIWQPWATLIAQGAKPYEFRTWDYSTRNGAIEGTRIVIHAGARPMKHKEIIDLQQRLVKEKGFGTGLIVEKALPLLLKISNSMENHGPHFDLPLSAAVCTATLLRARKASELFRGVADSDRIDQHVWAWPLQAIELPPAPIPCRGAQGFWNFPRDLEKAMSK